MLKSKILNQVQDLVQHDSLQHLTTFSAAVRFRMPVGD